MGKAGKPHSLEPATNRPRSTSSLIAFSNHSVSVLDSRCSPTFTAGPFVSHRCLNALALVRTESGSHIQLVLRLTNHFSTFLSPEFKCP